MLVKQELVNKVKDHFDLNVYETKVWLALLGKGVASAGEIADISRVPRSRTYDVLESLEKKGFAIVKLGKPVKYIGVKPNMILERLKSNVHEEAKERMSMLAKLKDTAEFSELENLYTEGINPVSRDDLSSVLKGKSTITTHIREIVTNAKEEVLVCMSAEELKVKTKLFQKTFELLRENGIKLSVALYGDAKLVSSLEKIFGMKFKLISIKAKFFVVDRKEILFYVSNASDREDLAIWLNSDFFSEAFAGLFERVLK